MKKNKDEVKFSKEVKKVAAILRGEHPDIETVDDMFDFLKIEKSLRSDFATACLFKQAMEYNGSIKKKGNENIKKKEYEIVKFKERDFLGRKKHGIKCGDRYVDLISPHFRWKIKSNNFGDCMGSLRKCRKVLTRFEDEGTPI